MTALHAAGGGLLLALQIPHVVEQAGSVAGFAAVIGLAVLSALYFSQARDLRRLREWAGRAPERAAEGTPAGAVPGRVVAVPQQQRPAQPGQPAPAPGNGAPAVAAKADEGQKPEQGTAAATNGDAAPTVTAPGAEGDESKEGAEKPAEGAPAKPGMPAPASAAAAAAGAGAKSVTAPGAPSDAAAKEGAAAAPASGGSAAGAPASAPGSPAPAPGSPGSAPGSAPSASGAAAPAAGAAAAAASTSASPKPGTPPATKPGGPPSAQPQRPPGSVLPPRTGTLPPVRRLPSSNVGAGAPQGPEKKKRSPVYVVLAVAGVLVLGAAAAIGVPAIINGTKDDDTPKSAAKTKKASAKTAVPVDPTKITVAVLNGTSIPGLAAQVADRVEAEGFTVGTISNASQTQTNRANSVAMYSSGHRSDASTVAKQLSIRNVQAIDTNSQSIAGDASVVVIVGSDKTQ